ncbi:Hypothetical predicted protein [Mytilus galloprovincialis]|uniref:Uncharacterized protein n=1 Tax=Mytilus galloprovincialis TaxID=29158 RepID=A0A8B6GT23_MYTGA|nr:Hypothetical predicted protein [Mytilus galloprovincialis]
MADATNTRASKPQAKLRDCLTGNDLDILDENEHINSDLNVTDAKIETLVIHTQCDGNTNNVTFKSLRSECWKQAIFNHFGLAKACLLKKGSVIKGKIYQNINNETSVPNLNNTSIIDNVDETIPKVLNDSHDNGLDNLHDEDDFTVASTPIKKSVVRETKLTPKKQKSNDLDTQIKQVISKQDEQSTSIESLYSIVTSSLQDRVEELENNRRTCNDNESPSVHNDISQVESTPISDTNNTSTKLSQVIKTKCDILILGDSILRRIQLKRFTPQGKTGVRYIRGGAKSCKSFVLKNGQRYEPKNILIHIGARDL